MDLETLRRIRDYLLETEQYELAHACSMDLDDQQTRRDRRRVQVLKAWERRTGTTSIKQRDGRPVGKPS